MHLVARTASRLPRAWNGRASTAAPSAAVRHTSNITREDFIEQVVGPGTGPQGKGDKTKKSPSAHQNRDSPTRKRSRKRSSNLFRKVPVVDTDPSPQGRGDQTDTSSLVYLARRPDNVVPFSVVRKVRTEPSVHAERALSEARGAQADPSSTLMGGVQEGSQTLIRKHEIHKERWKIPATMWPGKPPNVFSPGRVLYLKRLPAGTTREDIISSIGDTVHGLDFIHRSVRIADVSIKSRLDNTEQVDATVTFVHPDGAQSFYELVSQGQVKVRGVAPEMLLEFPQDPSNVTQPPEGNAVGELLKLDRAQFFKSPGQRRIVRRTNLIYN
ncbi:hypothetical protein diail_1848 [Diaporthe ilicicola]|nr:hypothetical protein diail_1848 [Diaporthe ilicicola]